MGNGVKTGSDNCNGKVMMGRVEFMACLKDAVGRLFYSSIWYLHLPLVFNLDSTRLDLEDSSHLSILTALVPH